MAYTLVVGTQEWSSWSLRPFLALSATGAPFETVVIRLRVKPPEPVTTRDEILKHSPAGKVPVLKIAQEGSVLTVWDSLAICETLAERHPEAKLWPADAGARAKARSISSEMHSGFPDVRDQLSMMFTRKLPLPELREDTQKQVARILEIWSDALKESQGDFLFGHFTIADCMYAPVVSRFDTYGVAVPPAVRAYMDRLLALPAMAVWRKGAVQEVAAGIA
ncbi:MAG: glutathione S-transferase family protein [Pseudomonadota bacterium]